ncbi:MAG: PASTA domain-containing protein [Spirochaetales bacterium]|jgi:serine/threonine-protein kinase|nr:PASTA domain-containing protein [Exilispira sp.]NMC68086.1 PASTA domain-containing protein [Spirochaetales bacterium]
MKKKHSLIIVIFYFIKKFFSDLIKKTKGIKHNFIRKKERVVHIANYLFTKDGFSFYLNKFKYRFKFLKYRIRYLIKSFLKHSKKIIDSGYLAFTIIFYIVLSIIIFLLTYNIWVQSYDTVKIPEFRNMRVLEAIEQIQSLNLIPVIESRFSHLPYGTIIFQYPHSGHVIKQQRKVKLVVSKGLESSFLEDFSGWTVFALQKKVQELSLILKREIKIEKIGEEYSDIFDKGLIISQQPQAGADLTTIDTIKIVVSKGTMPDFITIPDFSGKTVEQVQKEIETLGLILDIQYVQTDNLDKVGIVINQNPLANEKIAKGSTITIFVGQKKL